MVQMMRPLLAAPVDDIAQEWNSQEGRMHSNLVHYTRGHLCLEEMGLETGEVGLGVVPSTSMGGVGSALDDHAVLLFAVVGDGAHAPIVWPVGVSAG
jgi:hypothetical protein